jgi:DnaK suppressor protein
MAAIPDGAARALIADRRAIVDDRIAALDARLAQVRAARADWSDEEHDPEGFALTHEWSSAEGARQELHAELGELDAAERRIDAGQYGVCERCGFAIPVEQLRARPARRVHVACGSAGRAHR